jgi:hypothetical protein
MRDHPHWHGHMRRLLLQAREELRHGKRGETQRQDPRRGERAGAHGRPRSGQTLAYCPNLPRHAPRDRGPEDAPDHAAAHRGKVWSETMRQPTMLRVSKAETHCTVSAAVSRRRQSSQRMRTEDRHQPRRQLASRRQESTQKLTAIGLLRSGVRLSGTKQKHPAQQTAARQEALRPERRRRRESSRRLTTPSTTARLTTSSSLLT